MNKIIRSYDLDDCTAVVDVRAYLDYLDYDFEADTWSIWGEGDVDAARIRALSPEEDDFKAYPPMSRRISWTPDQHERRVRNLMEVLEFRPISLDIFQDGGIRMEDGCHRLLAAYLRGDETIKARIGGFIDYLPELACESAP